MEVSGLCEQKRLRVESPPGSAARLESRADSPLYKRFRGQLIQNYVAGALKNLYFRYMARFLVKS